MIAGHPLLPFATPVSKSALLCRETSERPGTQRASARQADTLALVAVGWVLPTGISPPPFGGVETGDLGGLAVLSTAIPSLAFAFASERLPSVVTAPTSLLIPLFAAAFAFVILGERISPAAIPGSQSNQAARDQR